MRKLITLSELRDYMVGPLPQMDKRIFLLGAEIQKQLDYECAVIGGKLARPEIYGIPGKNGVRKSSNDISTILIGTQVNGEKLLDIMKEHVCSKCREGRLICASEMQSVRKNLNALLQEEFDDRYTKFQYIAEENCPGI
jgi:translation initiation factor RLI1